MLSAIANRLSATWPARAAGRILRRVPGDWAVPVLMGPLTGTRWIVKSSVYGCWLGLYETDKLQFISRFLQAGDVCYDIGAQAGYHSIVASRCVGTAGTVYSFEPLPRNADYLHRHVLINGLSNVHLIRAAVSDTEGDVAFDPGYSFMAGRIAIGGALSIPSLTIDAWMQRARPLPPNLIKIDVEGAELRVLAGAEHTIRVHKPAIVLDTHDFLGGDSIGLHDDCCALLSKWDYRVSSDPKDKFRFARGIVATPL